MSDGGTASELADIFERIGAELSHGQQPDEVYALLTHAAVRDVPGAQQAGITLGVAGSFTTIAPTHELIRKVDRIQYDLTSGPCVDAILEDTVFNAPDLRSDHRWPEFGQRAFELAGVVSMLSLRVFFEDGPGAVAALNMYSSEVSAFGKTSQAIGLLLSTHGALALAAATANDKADNLLTALKNSREIGIAMGVLMTRHKITRERAFDLLRISSQHTHRKVVSIAIEVCDTGELPKLPDLAPTLLLPKPTSYPPVEPVA
ncbi:MAG: GAF and ANTAR domain-containing protein [Jatrophihabitantaceae bacterium]